MGFNLKKQHNMQNILKQQEFISATSLIIDHSDLIFEFLYGKRLSTNRGREHLITSLKTTYTYEVNKSFQLNQTEVYSKIFDCFSPPDKLLSAIQASYQLVHLICSDVIFTDLLEQLLEDESVIEAVQIIIKAYFRLRLDFNFDGDQYFIQNLRSMCDIESNWQIVNINNSLQHIGNFNLALFKLDEGDLSLNMDSVKAKGTSQKIEYRLAKQFRQRRTSLKLSKRHSKIPAKTNNSEIFHLLSGRKVSQVKNETSEYVDSITMQLLLLDRSKSNNEYVKYIPTQLISEDKSILIPEYTNASTLSRMMYNITQYSGITESECLNYISEYAALPRPFLDKLVVGERVLCLPQALRLDSALFLLANSPTKKYIPFSIMNEVLEILSTSNTNLNLKINRIANIFKNVRHFKSRYF